LWLATSAASPAFAQSIDESAASAAWKTAAVASGPAAPVASADLKATPANVVDTPPDSANADLTPAYAPIAEVAPPASAPSPRGFAPAPTRRISNAGSSNLMTMPSDSDDAPNASEIPSVSDATPYDQSAAAGPSQQIYQPGSSPPYQPGSYQLGSSQSPDPAFPEPNEITSYEQEQSGIPPDQLRNLQEYDSGTEMTTSLGMNLREDRRSLSSGQEADGLLVTGVKQGSAAADAGLHPYNATKHNMMTGVAMMGAMVFPPAILLVPALDYSAVGETYDLIIAVDGARVRNFLDFQDRTRDLQPGEILYLSVVRNGKRLQMKLLLTQACLTRANN
jgi:hypothetical protein